VGQKADRGKRPRGGEKRELSKHTVKGNRLGPALTADVDGRIKGNLVGENPPGITG
jgi:hypothetical protein